ncbi:MAG: phosphoribosylglycinamide formyltransferase [Flavobacteriaceae bacterium]|nr:phosphoribosylglycinamide formyltransferase [Flavobacteriaceae bacterium]|tara:strand:- start:2080 stop:2667 length:588 start_codon:yes stop_codon:yes gene_type:complete
MPFKENYKKKIVLFASGNGTNVENILNYFKNNNRVSFLKVFTNNSKALVLKKIAPFTIKSRCFNNIELKEDLIFKELKLLNPDLIVLAGFLLKMPTSIINYFQNKIINIHPALLPNYGGKGMYGINVHKAVKMNNEKKSGITIHYVDNDYDTGEIIFQKEVKISQLDSVEDISNKVHNLELEHFPKVIELILFKV